MGVNLGMTRLYGWGLKSERVEDYVPDVRFERSSVISTLRLTGINAPIVFKGALNGDLFTEYVKQALAPTLHGGDIVVMDNLSSHKVADALQPIYDAEARVLFLPPYSPDLNPIELAWSKIKSILRKCKARTHEELQSALRTAFEAITATDIEHWFAHDGYSFVPDMSM
jgi:transposase